MSYQSLIDDALARARARTGVVVPSVKTANAPLSDEAEKVANALEYLAYAAAEDGTAAGTARAELVRDFFKAANEGGAQPTVTSTDTKGTQAVAPQAGKTKLNPQGLASGNAPAQSTAPDGKMSRNVLEQTPPANPGKSANASLYDLLMAQKVANEGGAMPRQMDASQPAPSHPTGQEGGHAASPLASAQALINAKRKDLHDPTRARLREIFAGTTDTAVSMASAHAVAPQAAAQGGLKTAMSPEDAATLGAFLGSTPGAALGAGLAAPDGQGLRHALGAGAGNIVGGLAGGVTGLGLGGVTGAGLGALAGDPALGAVLGARMGAGLGGLGGGVVGARLGAKAMKREGREATASISLADLAVAFQKEGAAPGMPMGAPAPAAAPMPQAPAGGAGEDVQMLIQAAMQGDPRAAQMLAQMGITPESVMAQMQGGAPRPAAAPVAAAPMAAPAAAAGAPMMAPKAASAGGLLEYAYLWDAAYGGQLGEGLQSAAQGIVESLS